MELSRKFNEVFRGVSKRVKTFQDLQGSSRVFKRTLKALEGVPGGIRAFQEISATFQGVQRRFKTFRSHPNFQWSIRGSSRGVQGV